MSPEKLKSHKPRPIHFHLYRIDGQPIVALVFGIGLVVRVKHVVRHSPTGMEWGYAGSGPADCARSMLLALQRYCDLPDVEEIYHEFKWTFLSGLKESGGIIRIDKVLAWYVRDVYKRGFVDALWLPDELWLNEEGINGTKEAV